MIILQIELDWTIISWGTTSYEKYIYYFSSLVYSSPYRLSAARKSRDPVYSWQSWLSCSRQSNHTKASHNWFNDESLLQTTKMSGRIFGWAVVLREMTLSGNQGLLLESVPLQSWEFRNPVPEIHRVLSGHNHEKKQAGLEGRQPIACRIIKSGMTTAEKQKWPVSVQNLGHSSTN